MAERKPALCNAFLPCRYEGRKGPGRCPYLPDGGGSWLLLRWWCHGRGGRVSAAAAHGPQRPEILSMMCSEEHLLRCQAPTTAIAIQRCLFPEISRYDPSPHPRALGTSSHQAPAQRLAFLWQLPEASPVGKHN